MNKLVKSAEVQCRQTVTKSGIRQPPIKAFIDDQTDSEIDWLMNTHLIVPMGKYDLDSAILDPSDTYMHTTFYTPGNI